MIPELEEIAGSPDAVLPPGIHWTTLSEVEARFAGTPRRKWLYEGIVKVARALKLAGCSVMYLDGSFTTSKSAPGDFDGCWDPRGVDGTKLDNVFLTFENKCAAQKAKYRGEMFINIPGTAGGDTFLEFFQVDKTTGAKKGILGLRLDEERDL